MPTGHYLRHTPRGATQQLEAVTRTDPGPDRGAFATCTGCRRVRDCGVRSKLVRCALWRRLFAWRSARNP